MNDLLSIDGVLPIPHEYNKHIHMGSQSVLYNPTHDVAGDYEGPLVKSNLESVVFQQQEKVSSLILCSSSRS